MTRTLCLICDGRGTIKNPKSDTYQRDIECPNCNGEGFVGIPDNFTFKKSPYTQQKGEVEG